MAKERSTGPRASQGGYLGTITRGEMPLEFDRVAFSIPVGSVSDIVTTPFGFHIIKVTDRTPPKQLGYSEVSQKILQHLQSKRQQEAARAFLEKVSKKASIETHPDLLAETKP